MNKRGLAKYFHVDIIPLLWFHNKLLQAKHVIDYIIINFRSNRKDIAEIPLSDMSFDLSSSERAESSD